MKRFWFVIAIAVLGFLFVSNANAIAGKGEKGKIVVEIGDNFLEKKSKTKYFLQRNDTSLVPLTQEHFRDYPPRGRAKGRFCRLKEKENCVILKDHSILVKLKAN